MWCGSTFHLSTARHDYRGCHSSWNTELHWANFHMFVNETNPTLSPILHPTCYLLPLSLSAATHPHHSLTHASWLHYTPAKPSLWLRVTLQLIQLKHQKAFAMLPSSYPSQAPRGMGIHNSGDFPDSIFFFFLLNKQRVYQKRYITTGGV